MESAHRSLNYNISNTLYGFKIMFTLIAEKDVVLKAYHYLFSSQLRFGIIAWGSFTNNTFQSF